ncbi:MAG: hypothetical protein ABNH26_00785 [Celeribacter sp.]|jgi:hypothetical protein
MQHDVKNDLIRRNGCRPERRAEEKGNAMLERRWMTWIRDEAATLVTPPTWQRGRVRAVMIVRRDVKMEPNRAADRFNSNPGARHSA